jgi:hypothetical protein
MPRAPKRQRRAALIDLSVTSPRWLRRSGKKAADSPSDWNGFRHLLPAS